MMAKQFSLLRAPEKCWLARATSPGQKKLQRYPSPGMDGLFFPLTDTASAMIPRSMAGAYCSGRSPIGGLLEIWSESIFTPASGRPNQAQNSRRPPGGTAPPSEKVLHRQREALPIL